LNEIPDKDTNAIEKYNNLSALGPNKLTWSHIKRIIKGEEYINRFIDITNACINLEYWPYYFKMSMTVIIPKPNKASYNSPKFFYPIILLNMIGKLFEKMIGEHLQFHMISNSFIYPY